MGNHDVVVIDGGRRAGRNSGFALVRLNRMLIASTMYVQSDLHLAMISQPVGLSYDDLYREKKKKQKPTPWHRRQHGNKMKKDWQ